MKHPLDELLDEVRQLWQLASRIGERLHAGEPVTLGMRAVLESLKLDSPATVPAIARRRHVSRQHIQALVNALLAAGLVEPADNPAHRRSVLIRLTPGGRTAIDRMLSRERRFLDRVVPGAGREQLALAARTLRSTRATLSAADEHERAAHGGRHRG